MLSIAGCLIYLFDKILDTGLKIGQFKKHFGWSIAKIVVDMADTEVAFGYPIRGIVGEPGTRIDGFDQNAWLAALHYDKRDMKKSFAEYRAFREANVGLLRSLTPERWKICGMHKEHGPETIETVVKMFAGHDLNHFQQIAPILASRSK